MLERKRNSRGQFITVSNEFKQLQYQTDTKPKTKTYPVVQLTIGLFILLVILHYAGCIEVAKNMGN